MSIFKRIRSLFSDGGSKDDRWRQVTSKERIDELIRRSAKKPQLFYKHSNRCGICSFTKAELEGSEELARKTEMNFIDVISSREISNQISRQLEIRHASPQAIVLEDGKVVWSGSHGAIKSEEILKELED